jgi:signal transduction histidine kinase
MRRYFQALLWSAELVLTALVHAFVTIVGMLAIVLVFGLGIVVLLPKVVSLERALAGRARRRALAWSGVLIDEPYEPPPPPAVPMADGWYRSDRTLYRTPRVPDWNMRWKWMIADLATWRDKAWLALDSVLACALGALPLLLIAYGVALPFAWHPLAIPLGLALAAAGVLIAPRLLHAHARWTSLLLAPTARSRLSGAMWHLAATRSEAIDSQSAELRRIERELHDGAQARLIAVGMTLGAAEELVRTDPAAAKVLLASASDASAAALAELRRVVRGIHPPVLAERGLGDAIRALALDSPLRVRVVVDLPVRAQPPVESAAYFAVSQLLADAAARGDADEVLIDISHRDAALRVTITDDGRGGLDPTASAGMRDIERRLAAFDGVLAVSGPPSDLAGGPNVLTMDLPHALARTAVEPTPKMPTWKTVVVAIGWSLAWLPLFPQGLVPMIMKIIGAGDARSWFLVLYLPEPLQWPVAVFNTLLGASMIGAALTLPLLHSRERWLAEASPSRPWLES